VTRGDDVPTPRAMAMATEGDIRGGPSAPDAAPDGVKGRSIGPNVVADAAAARRQRFLRRMEQEASSVHFDSIRWMAQFPGATPGEAHRWAQRLLLPTEPQHAAEPALDSLAVVRGIALDAAYQLK
jgi:hypothetical protein